MKEIKLDLKYHSDRKIFFFDEIDSTNSALIREIEKDNCGRYDTFVTLCQTQGRGRGSKEFFSPNGGLYFSFRTIIPYNIQPLVTMAAGVATCKALRKFTNSSIYIKWVNDILYDNLKIVGILSEAMRDNTAVVGIGINCDNDDDLSNNYPNSTTIEKISGKKTNISDKMNILESVINNYDELVYSATSDARSEIPFEYKNLLGVLDKPVFDLENKKEAVCKDIDMYGFLKLVDKNGCEYTKSSGHINLI